MKLLKHIGRTVIVLTVGLALGLWISRFVSAKVQAASSTVYIQEIPFVASTSHPVTIKGSEVVGFSCTQDSQDVGRKCYIASR